MITLALPYPAIDPVAIEIGPFAVRWYALAYITGLVVGWRYCRALAARSPHGITPEAFDDFLLWATIGIVVGGRLGYVLFYNFGYYLSYPVEILYLWRGGMSFHGGLLGIIVTMWLFARQRSMSVFAVSDIVASAGPIGLFFGRIANFINGELYGRFTDAPWGMVFPGGGSLPRHPSQLYEAFLEGIVLFTVLFALVRRGALDQLGLLSGAFLAGYALARMVAELFREPDAHIGYLAVGTTMGQLLSIPMLLVGAYLIYWAQRVR